MFPARYWWCRCFHINLVTQRKCTQPRNSVKIWFHLYYIQNRNTIYVLKCTHSKFIKPGQCLHSVKTKFTLIIIHFGERKEKCTRSQKCKHTRWSIFTKEHKRVPERSRRKHSFKWPLLSSRVVSQTSLSTFISVSKSIPVIPRQEIAYLTPSKWGEKSTSVHQTSSQMLNKVHVITKISCFIKYELFWFTVCTLSQCLWVVFKLQTTPFSEQILDFTSREAT